MHLQWHMVMQNDRNIIRFKSGVVSGVWWWWVQSAQALETAITSASKTGTFRLMKDDYGGVWQMSGLPPLPWDLRITSATKAERLLARQTHLQFALLISTITSHATWFCMLSTSSSQPSIVCKTRYICYGSGEPLTQSHLLATFAGRQ